MTNVKEETERERENWTAQQWADYAAEMKKRGRQAEAEEAEYQREQQEEIDRMETLDPNDPEQRARWEREAEHARQEWEKSKAEEKAKREAEAKHQRQEKLEEAKAGFYNPWIEKLGPKFPLEILPNVVRSFVEAKAKETGADVSAIAMAALAVVSGAISHESVLYLKPGKHFGVSPRLWVALVGEVSSKKTPIVSAVTAPLQRIERRNMKDHAEAVAMMEAECEAAGTEVPEMQAPPQLIANDVTPEMLAQIVSQQNRGIFVSRDELSGWLGDHDRYNNNSRPFWLQAYSGGSWNLQRIGRATVPIENLSVSILGGIQPSKLREFRGLTSDGLIQRFLPVMMRADEMDSDDFDIEARDAWAKFIERMHSQGLVELVLSFDATLVRERVRQKIHDLSRIDTEGQGFQTFVGKLQGVWGTLCMLLHVMHEEPRAYDDVQEIDGEVSGETAERAELLLNKFILQHGYLFYRSLAEKEDHTDRQIAAFLVNFKGEPDNKKGGEMQKDFSGHLIFRVRNMQRALSFCKGKTVEEIAKYLGPFEASNWIAPADDKWPTTKWVINPDARIFFAVEAERQAEAMRKLREEIVEAATAKKKKGRR